MLLWQCLSCITRCCCWSLFSFSVCRATIMSSSLSCPSTPRLNRCSHLKILTNSTIAVQTSKQLERALYFMDNNRFALISAFYPARESPTLFLNVRYNFSTPENYQTELNICHNWLWTTGTFYLIQSPDVFLFTSLLFVHPENKVHTLKLTLPPECADLAEKCASNPNSVSMLEVLTRRVS